MPNGKEPRQNGSTDLPPCGSLVLGGTLSPVAGGDAPINVNPFFWGSGVKTADTTMMSHSNGEGMLLRSHASP